jgi:hypothetical protein
MASEVQDRTDAATKVMLYWLPLGAGGHSVRWNGRVFEAVAARHEHRAARDLYHSALEVHLGGDRYVIEMAPAWSSKIADRGVVQQGPVGAAWLGHSVLFRYEVRRWRNGVIPDVSEAVASPQLVSHDLVRVRRLLALVPLVPAATWGRDELSTGEMWNSNSVISWLLARTDHEMDAIHPPSNGRAPGWDAGLIVAARQKNRVGGVTASKAAPPETDAASRPAYS